MGKTKTKQKKENQKGGSKKKFSEREENILVNPLGELKSSLHQYKILGEQEVPDDINVYQYFFPNSERDCEYRNRRSILDEYHGDSYLRKSIYYGYFQLFFMFSCYFFVCHPLTRFFDQGYFMQSQLISWVSQDLLQVFALWPQMVVYLHVGYILQIVKLPSKIEKILQFIWSILSFYLFSYYIPFTTYKNWVNTSRAFSAICNIAMTMKFHSYMVENRRFRKEDPKYKPKYKDFLYFVCAPAFIFQKQFPRNEKIEWKFFLIKSIFSLMGCIGIYFLTNDWLLPILETAEKTDFVTLLLELIEICFYFNLAVFYLIFENIMQGIAELTRFADREFYRDWWNTTNYIDFFTKNNRPLYNFSLKYIKTPIMQKFKISHKLGNYIILCFMAIMHELVIVVVSQTFTPFVLIIFILQLPLIGLLQKFEGGDWGNIIFWFLYLLAVPLVVAIYIKSNQILALFDTYN